jgi:hypothetical protein
MRADDVRYVTDLTARLVRESVARAGRGGLAVPVLRPATLGSWSGDASTAIVRVDGDANSIQVVNLTGAEYTPGRRVMILFQPPHGAFLIGTLGSPIAAVSDYTGYAVSQLAVPSRTNPTGRYSQNGPWVHFQWELSFTSAGNLGAEITLSGLPIPAGVVGAGNAVTVGTFQYYDAGNTIFAGAVVLEPSNQWLRFRYTGFGSSMGAGDIEIANGDSMSGFCIYQAE